MPSTKPEKSLSFPEAFSSLNLLPYLTALLDLSSLQHRSTSRLLRVTGLTSIQRPSIGLFRLDHSAVMASKRVVYKLVVLGGAGVGKTALTLQVRPFLYLHVPDQSLISNS